VDQAVSEADQKETLDLECQLRLIDHIESNLPPCDPLALWVEGFWAAVAALEQPRDRGTLQSAIALRRARAAGIIK
jgi:hypothetical protein